MPKRKLESTSSEQTPPKHQRVDSNPRLSGSRKESEQISVSASSTRNYMLNDSLVDWLNLYDCESNEPIKTHSTAVTSKVTIRNPDTFLSYILNRGLEFEKSVVDHISKNKVPVTFISDTYNSEGIERTIQHMMRGTPVLYSAPLHNPVNNTCGIADLIVRSDYISKIVTIPPLSREERRIPGPRLGAVAYHYIVVDIKFATLQLTSDGIHLLNTSSFPAYKAQLFIYNEMVGLIQGYTPRSAYILGRRWTYTKRGIVRKGHSFLDRLGCIEYTERDSRYISETGNAVNWLKEVRSVGKTWSIDPPSRLELYPNLKVDSGWWNCRKWEIAKSISDITMIWNCGPKNRNVALTKGITNWNDERCNASTLGIKGSRAKVVDSIIQINRPTTTDLITPARITHNTHNWKVKSREIFVDFEVFIDIFSPFDKPVEPDLIFMIGAGYVADDGNWIYRSFIVNRPTIPEETRILRDFSRFITDGGFTTIWYWYAEKNFWEKAMNKRQHPRLKLPGRWADLRELFVNEPITIKGCYRFDLKSIVRAMTQHGMINIDYSAIGVSDGKTAMIRAWKYFERNDDTGDDISNIVRYNELDCKSLSEIITYLRLNHV